MKKYCKLFDIGLVSMIVDIELSAALELAIARLTYVCFVHMYVYACMCVFACPCAYVLRLVFELDLVIYDNNNLLIDLIVRVLFSMHYAHTHIYKLTHTHTPTHTLCKCVQGLGYGTRGKKRSYKC